MIMGPLLRLLGPLEAHIRPLWAPWSPTVALRGPSGPLGVLLESSVALSIPFETLQGSLDLGIWAPARALGRGGRGPIATVFPGDFLGGHFGPF